METKVTTQGSIYLLLSRIAILVCGLIIHIFLARWLGPAVYGLYGLIMSVLLWIEYTVTIGIPSTYRKVISEDEEMVDSAIYSIKKIFVPYCLAVLAVFLIVAPLLSQAFNDNRLFLLLLIAGLDIPFYGLYYAYLGIINGSRKFFQESIAVSGYVLFKTIFVIIFVLFKLGIIGALIGNILASLFGILITSFFIKRLRDQRSKRKVIDLMPRIVKFGFPYLLYMLATMLLIHIGLWFIKGLLNDDLLTGFYSVAYNLSRPLYFLTTGIIAVMFPSFSKAVSEGNTELSQKYIQQAMRFILVALFPLVMIIGFTSEQFITLLFTSAYLPASSSLKILLFGMLVFSVLALFLNLIAAKNKPLCSFIISLALLPLAIALNYFLINSYGIVGAALATTIVSSIGLIVAGGYLSKTFGALINFSTVWKVILATGILCLISKYIAISGYWLILEYFLLSLIYLVLLLALREINSGDIAIIKETCYSLFRPAQIQTR